jgi:hypothetical protein
MASTYSQYKIQLIGTGDEAGQWGTITNNNFGSATPGTYRGFEQAIGGRADVTMSSTTITLSLTDSNAAQDARALYLNLTGTPGGAADLVVPALQKSYLVKNGTTGGFAVTIKVTGQTGVSIPNGKTVWVYNNGTDVVTAVDHIPSLTLGAALPIASGGTGSTSTTFVNLATNVTGTLPVANGGTGITSFGTGVGTALGVNTGSAGAFVVNGGALGTPSSGTLTNATGLPIATGVSGLGTNVATFLGTPSSANLAAALTDETGTGLAVFGTNPTLTGVTLAGEAACADNLVTRATLKDYAIEGSAVGSTGATRTFDLSVANFFSATLDQACTFTFSNPPASGDFGTFVLELTNGGAFAITYPASVDFVGGVAPTLTASGVDQLVFTTRDGGTTYFGFVAGLDIKSP